MGETNLPPEVWAAVAMLAAAHAGTLLTRVALTRPGKLTRSDMRAQAVLAAITLACVTAAGAPPWARGLLLGLVLITGYLSTHLPWRHRSPRRTPGRLRAAFGRLTSPRFGRLGALRRSVRVDR